MTSLTTSSQLGIGSLAPPQQTQQERFAELQSLVAPSQQQARDVAMGNALTRFGAAMQTPGLSLAQAFGYAAPQFTETMNKHRQAVADRNLQLQLAARAEQKAAEKEGRELSYKVYTAQLSKMPDVEFGTYYNPNMPDLSPLQGARLPDGQTVVLNPETQEWGPGDGFIEAPAGVQTAYSGMVASSKSFPQQLKEAATSKATIIDPSNPGQKNEVTVYTNPNWPSQLVNVGNEYKPLKEVYPNAISGAFDDNVEVKSELHRTIITPKSVLKIPTGDGSTVVFDTPMVRANTNIHQKFYTDSLGNQINREHYVDGRFSNQNQTGTLYAEPTVQIGSLADLDEGTFKQVRDKMRVTQLAIEELDSIIGDTKALSAGENKSLVGFTNAFKRKYGNTFFANAGALLLGGDEKGALTSEAQERALSQLEQYTKYMTQAFIVSGRGAVWEQSLFRDRSGVATANDLFGNVTTMEKLRQIRTQLVNFLNDGRSLVSPEGTPAFRVKAAPSFKKGDEGRFDLTFIRDGDKIKHQLDSSTDTGHHKQMIMNLHDLKGEGITNSMKINLLKNRFAILSPRAQASYQTANNGVPFPGMKKGGVVNLYDLAAAMGITFDVQSPVQ